MRTITGGRAQGSNAPGSVEVSVIVPSWGKRPTAAGAIDRYRDALETAGTGYEILVLPEPQVWGAAICLGLHRSRGAYVLAGVDDCPAFKDEWVLDALTLAAAGDVVGARIFENDEDEIPRAVSYCGTTELRERGGEIPFAMSPLASRETWAALGPLPPTHAYTDIFIADKARSLRRRVVCCPTWEALHECPTGPSRIDAQVYEAWKEIYAHDGLGVMQ